MHNIFGDKFSFLSFGESHSAAIGGVLDGVPAGIEIDLSLIRRELDRRAGRHDDNANANAVGDRGDQNANENENAGGSSVRAKREKDEVEWLSGVINVNENANANAVSDRGDQNENANANENENVDREKWVTIGTPIAFMIRNTDARPEDYEWLRHTYRSGHADRTYEDKYGIRDHRGGGRASARETAGRVVAGSIAQQLLREHGIAIHAQLIQVGAETRAEHFEETIRRYQAEGDSIGGIIRCEVTGLPAGLGEPIFDKIQSHLAYAMLSINACKGFDYGSGFEGIAEPGSIANRESGGLLGGITDGSTLSFRCVFKPTPTTRKSIGEGKRFRSDACVAVRAVAVVEAMTAMVLKNFI